MPGTCSPLAEAGLPETMAVSVSPNPFPENFQVQFFSASGAKITLSLYDATGRLVMSQVIEKSQPGRNTVVMQPGRDLPAGMYLLKLITGAGAVAKTMVRI
jgi:hypothetical protein